MQHVSRFRILHDLQSDSSWASKQNQNFLSSFYIFRRNSAKLSQTVLKRLHLQNSLFSELRVVLVQPHCQFPFQHYRRNLTDIFIRIIFRGHIADSCKLEEMSPEPVSTFPARTVPQRYEGSPGQKEVPTVYGRQCEIVV
jgi:hypothetical protein